MFFICGGVRPTFCVTFVTLVLIVVANTILSSCFWLARERGFKTKTIESIVGGYWVVVGSAQESES
ncbi:hypothetical protein H5410_027781 [Solanum commersonii]|uniref:Uncharacterized protein n=1 Tax=Solanum commersonii TaxID=4109 RepID=A0A9J5Z051_SOLCO|nr:hypothetical protein H5410_027781 [Solanum commersonii]